MSTEGHRTQPHTAAHTTGTKPLEPGYLMHIQDLKKILTKFPTLNILVIGDYFLDRYLTIDPNLAETSLETNLEARQITHIRNQPGAAGTVTSNLCALGIGKVHALGIIGDDGQGYDLKKGLQETGVDTTHLIETSTRFTPTYTKPLNKKTGAEMERLDIKNRTPLSPNLENQLIDTLHHLLPQVNGVIALDQVQEPNCGVLTDRVTTQLAHVSKQHPEIIFFADSRTRITDFKNVILKPNRDEAIQATGEQDLHRCARAFAQQTGKPIFITQGPNGILVANDKNLTHIPAIPVPDPIDIVGAGDSVSAAVVSALCAGATPPQAAQLGVLASSITIQQIGTTGTASPEQITKRFQETTDKSAKRKAQSAKRRNT